VVEDPDRLVRTVAPQLGEREIPDRLPGQVPMAQHPVADLDGIDDPGLGAVRDESGRRHDSVVVRRRQALRAVEEHLLVRQMVIAGHDEPHRQARPVVQTELLDPRDAGQVCVVRQG
jgi:hypothetical protein